MVPFCFCALNCSIQVSECHRGFTVCVSSEEVLQGLLSELTYSLNSAPLASTALERKQALAKQFAEILHFTLLFDELKVC